MSHASDPLVAALDEAPSRPSLITCLELLKPITWFPPMWAFMCGVVSAGVAFSDNWFAIIGGLLLVGPLVCAMSQATNDWHDRFVDAINEPHRPIPSGRMPGMWGLYIALIWTVLSLAVAVLLGTTVLIATIVGLALAWAYSAPPFRLKMNGWLGGAACAICYEGLAWFTGAAVLVQGWPDIRIVALAALYSFGAHGIMTLNDFKAIEGDTQMGVKTLPVLHGTASAARIASVIMTVPQLIVIALLYSWGQTGHAFAIAGLLLVQVFFMFRYLLDDASIRLNPRKNAAFYNLFGVTLYVAGMMTSAFAVRGILMVSP
ncbi:MAG: chlorophyll synthase ChlG [Pseudomonadota bacterium]